MKKSVSFFLGTLLSDQPASNEATNCRVSRMSGPHLKSWRQQRPGCIQKINIFYFRDLFFSPRVGYRGASCILVQARRYLSTRRIRGIYWSLNVKIPCFLTCVPSRFEGVNFPGIAPTRYKFSRNLVYTAARARHGNRRRKTYILQHLQLCKTNAYIQCALIFIGNPL